MKHEDSSSTNDEDQTSLEAERLMRLEENFGFDLDYAIVDYLALPRYGEGYFSLVDASILAALDAWWNEHGEDDPDFGDLVGNPTAREASEPLQRKVLQALTKAVEEKELDAEICARDLSTFAIIPDRTYAHIADIRACVELFGLGNGHLMQNAEQLDDDDTYERAAAICRKRAAIRLGVDPARHEVPNGNPFDVIEILRNELGAKKLQIADLEKKMARGRGEDAGLLGARQRNNLHRTVGALLEIALPLFNNKQDALIAEIESRFSGAEGLSKRTLEAVFPRARKALTTAANHRR